MVIVINPASHTSRSPGGETIAGRSYLYPLEGEGRRNARSQIRTPGKNRKSIVFLNFNRSKIRLLNIKM